jgi:hypothetical protein
MAEEENKFNENLSEDISQKLQENFFAKEFGGEYSGSRIQYEYYKSLKTKDLEYEKFIEDNYGSYDNYLRVSKVEEGLGIFDPTVDYIIDVQIVTKDKSYRTDHISAEEVIMEALTGICTVVFMKVNGSVGRITGTLEKKSIPTKQYRVRSQLFSPQKGDRIIMWDINKQDWRSFYMERVIKFIRDDTIGLE